MYIDNCLNRFKQLKDESVDLIIADPPFGIGFDGKGSQYNRDAEYVVDGYVEAPPVDYWNFTMRWLCEALPKLKRNGSMYIYSSWNNLEQVLRAIDDLELTRRGHIIWYKTFGVYSRWKYVDSHYHIIHVTQTDDFRPTFNAVMRRRDDRLGSWYFYPENVFFHKVKYQPGEKKNGTKLPLEQIIELVMRSSNEGDLVLDPFLGNGTTVEAAVLLKRRFVGFEMNPQCVEVLEDMFRRLGYGEAPIQLSEQLS